MRKLYTAAFQFRLFLFTVTTIFSGLCATGQTTVQIGTGTDIPDNTLYSPVYRFSATSTTTGSRSNIVFTAAEMAAAGIPSGAVITKVEFNKTNAANFVTPATHKMYMANTANTSLATTTTWASILTTHTQVYTSAAFNMPLAAGWVPWDVTPFTYTGGSFEIATETSMVGNGGATDAFKWEYTTSIPADRIIGVASATGATLNGTVAAYKHRPNIRITFSASTACVTPPTAGDASAAPAIACIGNPVNLNLSGFSLGAGQTYQWESAAAAAGPFTPIGTALTSPSFSTTVAAGTTYFRCAVTCSGNTQYSDTVSASRTAGLPAGTYTINSGSPTAGTNYANFTDAVAALSCGIQGAVVFNVTSPNTTVYNEQISIPQIPGTSTANTVTFNGNNNTIAFTSTNTNQRAVITLNGADHLTFNDMVINANGTTTSEYGWGIFLTNNADTNVFRRCQINVNTTSTSTNYAGIVISGSATSATGTGTPECDNNMFEGNIVTGGYYSMTMVGSGATSFNSWNTVKNNIFKDYYTYGLYVNGSFDALIEGNIFTRPVRTAVGAFYGIYLTGVSASAKLYRNTITNPFGGAPTSSSTFYGIYFTSVDALAARENVAANNVMYNITGTGDVYGIYSAGSDLALYYHNTIHLDGASTATNTVIRGFYQTTSAADVGFKNNIITISRISPSPKHCLYFNTPASTIASNNNVLFISSATGSNNIGYNGTDQATLANWQAATSQDAASMSTDPIYTNIATGDLEPTNASINDLGRPVVPAITVDFENETRSATTPDMGAYEFAPPPCTAPPVAGAATVSQSPVCENTLVTLNLTGNSTGLSQTYQWEVSTSAGGTYAPISGVLTNPSFNITSSTTLYYRAAVTCSGSTAYSTPVLVTVNPALPGGNYTIDLGGTGDYLNFNEAKAAMACGIAGPVVFTVAQNSGPYLEQLVLDSIPGTSATNTVTFNGNGNVIRFSSPNTNERAVITLRSTDYITFDSLVIDATGTEAYGWGVFLTNNADSNTFRRCNVIVTTESISTNFAGVVISSSPTGAITSGSSFCDGNLFDRNTITGGYYGMTMMGGTANLIQGNRFTNNLVKDFYSYGIYIGPTLNAVVENNRITRPVRTGVTTFYGIYSSGISNNLRISKNRIYNPFAGNTSSTSTAYGIYITANDAPDAGKTRVTNNIFYNIDGSGAIYGLYNSSSDNVLYYHNTISADNTASTSTSTIYGSYQITEATGLEYKNNIITITRGGNATKYGLYFSSSTTAFTSNRNNIFVNGASGANNFGYFTAARATLAAWQTATSQDANSFSVDPQYTDIPTGNLTPMQALIDNNGEFVNVTTDIINATRSSTTPDIGAFEFSVTPCTAPPTPGTAIANPVTGLCLGEQVTLNLTGNSTGGFQKYVWQRAATATGTWTDISDTLYTPELVHELASPDTWFRCVVVCGTGIAYSTPVQVTLNPLLIAGDYTINPAIPASATNFQSFATAVAAMQCGIQGSVRFHAVPGTYTEQIRIRKVPGTSATSTVTFMSQTGDPTSVILTFGGTTANNYVLKLDSASYITFKNMTITASDATNGRAIEFGGTASNDSILKCVVNVPPSTSTATTIAGIFGTGLTGSDIVIKGNTVTNGSSGIYLSGTTLQSNNYVIDSNIVSGSYYYSIYAGNLNRSRVNGNTLTRSGVQNTSAYAIYATNCDSAYQINNNLINIANTGITVYGIYSTGNQAKNTERGSIANNKIIAGAGNTGNMYGIYVTSNTFANALNNVVVINTSGATSYGIYSTGTGGVRFWNNSVQSSATSATNNIAAYFSQSSGANGAADIRNNIFSHTGGGRALYIVNPNFIYSDYNMFYTSGATLVQYGTANSYATLEEWKNAAYWDFNSIVYKPAFTSATDLRPDAASPDVWAIHGRGVQIEGNNLDIENKTRPVTLTAGVPDLGAYEFVPTSTPVLLTAVPAAPAPNTTQTFMLGTDTVTKITWGATVPATIEGRRYSGIMPPGLASGQDYMYFYTDFNTTGSNPTGHAVKQFYIDPWQGFISTQPAIKLGRTNTSNVWQVATSSTVDIYANVIQESNLTNLDKYTGLTDGNAAPPPPVVINPSDSSNRGTKFWVGYGHHQDFGSGNAQEMVLYLGAGATAANVTVRINGTAWMRNYTVPANSVISSDFLPKYGLFDSRLLEEGLSEKGISIESDVPITAYAHIYGNTNSGATMLMPVGTYGYEYYALTSKQNYASNTYSWFYVVAAYDSTVVEITPSKPSLNGRPAGVPFTVNLKKGEVYQVLGAIISGSDGYDLTGSKVKSIANVNGKCYPVAVFSGSSRTNIGCGTSTPSGSGDNIIQQNFPSRAWGRRYLTAPTSHQNAANQLNGNIFKVVVKDPTTVVLRNGTALTGLIDNLYYQVESSVGDYFEADKPIMVAQFMPSSVSGNGCGYTGYGDPEMIYLSPIEQGIKNVALYRNTEYSITVQYLTLIIPSNGVNSLTIDGTNTFDYVYDHPNLAGYKVVVKRWSATNGQTVVNSDSAFTAITYGLGSAESYGYNAGTLVINLNTVPAISNVFNPATGATNPYTCAGTPFRFKFLASVQPTVIEWQLSSIPNMTPNANITQNNPTPSRTVTINGMTYYEYTLNTDYVITTPGDYRATVFITHPSLEGCNSRLETSVPVKVLAAPVVDFSVTGNCIGGAVQLNGTATTANNTPINSWKWDFDDAGATATTQNATHTFTTTGTYDVELSVIGQEGCIGEVTKQITVGAGPAVNFVPDSVAACVGDNVTFNVQNPVAGAIYNWYSGPAGGTLVHTGTSYTISNITSAVSYYVEASLNGCISAARKRVHVVILPDLSNPVAVVDSVGTNLIRFRWNAVTNATGYQVTVDGGTTWITPSSGATGLTHTVTGLQVGASVTLRVRAIGGCEPAISAEVTARTITDQVYVPNSFTPNGDGLNDNFSIYGYSISNIKVAVFNQWGEKIAEVTNPIRDANGGYLIWDGRQKGKLQPSGVYMFVADMTLTDGSKVQRKGSINLIR